jgi:hypothetical protein
VKSEIFALHVKTTFGILLNGTVQKKFVPQIAKFGTAKQPRPSQQFPKGALKITKYKDEQLYLYSWMDSAGVYFIDTVRGPYTFDTIHRKNSTGQKVAFEVPEMIVLYNNNMHAVDVFDQIRKFFGVDLSHKTFKWTVRMMEILFSMILGQAYNVYRAIHKGNKDKQRSHTQFKV